MVAERDAKPPSLAGAPWLTAAGTQAVFKAITDAGYSVRVVGGAVRNALLGRPVKDVDFATTARPEEVLALAAASGITAVPTGLAHGTVTLVAGHLPYEVTTLREDVETFGRHARVAFTEDWAADARRRDFTINALYCDATGEINDPLGGYPDLVARRVRFIGNADERIREDYLRILRFFRFHAEYATSDFDGPSLEACTREKEGLRKLSGERTRAELLRLLSAPGAVASITGMSDIGILQIVLGEQPALEPFLALTDIEQALGRPPDAILRLAALTVPQIAPGTLKGRLKLSTAETAQLHVFARNTGVLQQTMAEQEIKAMIYRLGRGPFEALVCFEWARSSDDTQPPSWRHMLELAAGWQIPVMPIRGADLLARGLAAGPRIGRIVTAFERWWIAEGFPADADRIEAALQTLIANDVA